MASSAGRTLRGASRLILQVASSKCGRIASQAGSPKLQAVRAFHQAVGISLVKQAQRNFTASISRTASACVVMSTASPLSNCGSLLCAGSSSDVMEGSAGDEEGLVIEAVQKLEDL